MEIEERICAEISYLNFLPLKLYKYVVSKKTERDERRWHHYSPIQQHTQPKPSSSPATKNQPDNEQSRLEFLLQNWYRSFNSLGRLSEGVQVMMR